MNRSTVGLLLALVVPCASDVAAQHRDGLEALTELLQRSPEDTFRRDLLTGMLKGLEGRRRVEMPAAWPAAYVELQRSRDASVRDLALSLALVFDDPVAFNTLRRQAVDSTASATARNQAIQALVAKRQAGLAPLLLRLVRDPTTRSTAVRGLADFNHPATASTLLDNYSEFDRAARRDAVQTLASRPSWAHALLAAVSSNRVPRTDLTAYTARQLRNLGSAEITGKVRAIWGEVRSTPTEKAELIRDFKQRLTVESLQRANRSAGRAIYQKTCANCHRLFDAGGSIGPEITGAQRSNLDYILENLIDPNATVSKDFQMQVIRTSDGRVITGLVVGENNQAVTIQTVNEKLVVPAKEIEIRTKSPASMMPEGMLDKLSTRQVRDLVGYLRGRTQVALPQSDVAEAK